MTVEASSFQHTLEAIREDRVHGASFLGQRAIWALALAASEDGATERSVTTAAEALAQARPHMGSIVNGVQMLLRRLREASWELRNASALASELIAEAQRKAEEAAGHAAALLPQEGTVLTCSYSGTVVQTLWAAQRLGRQLTVKVLPSAGYGRLMAGEARRLGVPVEVVNTLPKGATADNTAGLIGADTVVPGKVVINGAPSLGLAKWCSDRAIRLYVVCDSLKVLAQAPMGPRRSRLGWSGFRCGTWRPW